MTDTVHEGPLVSAAPAETGLTQARVAQLIELAIREGQGPQAVEVIERLVAVAERIDNRRAREEFNRAYAAFRAQCPLVPKSRTATVATSSGSKFSWDYAPYEEIRRVCDPVLLKCGLSISHDSDDRPDAVTGIVTIRHLGGHSESSRFTARKGGANPKISPGQQDGGTLTLALRRALQMALGVVTSEDGPGGTTSDEAITETQAHDLEALIADVGANKARFLRYFEIETVASMPASRYKEAVAMLEQKRGAR